MANPPVELFRDFEDASQEPIINLTGVATLIGGSQYLVTGTATYLLRPSRAVTSTGAQADGPPPSVSEARAVGGLIEDGVYDVVWTYWDGAESLTSSVVTVTIATSGADTGSIVHTLPLFPSTAIWAYGYRQKDASGHFYRFATITDLTVKTFIDTQIESAISGNPEPATSAPPAGRITFLLTAPADISDPTNGAAIISYSIVIADQTYYTTTFAYTGSPIELGTVLVSAPSAGILTRIYWDDAYVSDAPLTGKVAVWRISQDCFATDTGKAYFAGQDLLSLPADSQGHGYVDLKPNAETSAPGSFYRYQLIQNESQIFAVVVPMPDSIGHPNGFALSELAIALVGPPDAVVADIDQIRADITEIDDPQKSPLVLGDPAELEFVNIRERLRHDMGLAATHWKDNRATLTTTSDAAIGGNASVTGSIASTNGPIASGAQYIRGPHLGGYPVSKHVTLATGAAAGTGATISTPISSGVPSTGQCFAGDAYGDDIQLVTGTGPTAGLLFTITYHDAYTQTMGVLVPDGCDTATKALHPYAIDHPDKGGADVYAVVQPDPSTTYLFKYICHGI